MSKGSAVKLSFWLQEGDIILLERLPPVCRIECRWYILLNSTHTFCGRSQSTFWVWEKVFGDLFQSCLQLSNIFTFLQYSFLSKGTTLQDWDICQIHETIHPKQKTRNWWPAKLLVLLRSEPLKMEVHFEMHSWELNAPFVYVCVLETRCWTLGGHLQGVCFV